MADVKQHRHILLTSSGCLSQMACRYYAKNKLSPEHLALVEAHLKTCDLCRDAMEGLGMVLPPKASEEASDENFSSLEHNIDAITEKRKNKRNKKQRRIIYLSGVAASIVIALAILVTVRYEEFLNSSTLAENAVEKVPIDQLNVDLAVYKGHFFAPVNEQNDGTEMGYSSTKRNRTESLTDNEMHDKAELRASAINKDEISNEEISSTQDGKIEAKTSSEVVANSEVFADDENENPDLRGQTPALSVPEKEERSVAGEEASSSSADRSLPSFLNEAGVEKFKDYLNEEYQKLGTPEKPSQPLTGVKIKAVVNENGKLENINVRNTVDSFQEQRLRSILSQAPQWQPATKNGKAVKKGIEISFD